MMVCCVVPQSFDSHTILLIYSQSVHLGSFGGTYFRPIYSSVVNRAITSKEAIQDLPEKWLAGVNIPEMITSST